MGYFILKQGDTELKVKNHVPLEGIEAIYKTFFQANNPGTIKLGLTGATSDFTTLSDLTGEPASGEGYARQTLARNTTGFPAINKLQNMVEVVSKAVRFTPQVGYTQKVKRAFLCTDSVLIGMSDPFPEKQITAQAPLEISYHFDGA